MADSFERKQYLDHLRGFAVFLMLFVNVPGSWGFIYPQLKHAEGNGFHLADLVFPLFLWAVGYSLMISSSKRSEESLSDFWKRILFRSTALFLMGLFLSLFPKWDWETFRIPGVLQRIALLYFCGAVWIRYVPKQKFFPSIWILFLLVICFACLNRFFSISSDSNSISFVKEEPLVSNTLGALTDRFVFGNHLWKETKNYDPEGIFSSIPAFLTVMLGAVSFLRRKKYSDGNLFLRCRFEFLVYPVLSFAFSLIFPLNKTNWSLSFIFFTAFLSECLCSLFVVWEKFSLGSRLGFGLYGRNALLVFFLTGFVTRLSVFSKLRSYLYGNFKQLTANPEFASFLFSCMYLIAILLFCFLWEKGKNFFPRQKTNS
ncbi:heparan-alpha-glucosaminide N-acetyltransferase domain-containing protein [Leptospira idonii]|uniref:DUF1624 domain-containing protein n=1 Tax=Leptospira idonii TaxID=1193500 RepID=A0A4R9LX41_9LEPT|nr:heparan-alpha-glucosaminide N-acetyltransferase domain-containing protein [Leptospira idonii]TGN17579.1 DUF1624 domain-containing protein [Leptospira idonii]